MTEWRPNQRTKQIIGDFVELENAVLPEQLGIDELIAGCEIINLDPYATGVYPRYIRVSLRGEYHVDAYYRGGIAALAVGDEVFVTHLREGNRYEVYGPSGSSGPVIPGADPGMWLAERIAAGIRYFDFEPDTPAVVTGAGVVTEYATIQAAITAASAGEVVVVPPGTYDENLTLKAGVPVVELFSGTVTILATGGISAVTVPAAGGNYYLNVHRVQAVQSLASGGAATGLAAVMASHASGTFTLVADLYCYNTFPDGNANAMGIRHSGAGEIVYHGQDAEWNIDVQSDGNDWGGYGVRGESTGDIRGYGTIRVVCPNPNCWGYCLQPRAASAWFWRGDMYMDCSYDTDVIHTRAGAILDYEGDVYAHCASDIRGILARDGACRVTAHSHMVLEADAGYAIGLANTYAGYESDSDIVYEGIIEASTANGSARGVDVQGGTCTGEITLLDVDVHADGTGDSYGANIEVAGATVTVINGRLEATSSGGVAWDLRQTAGTLAAFAPQHDTRTGTITWLDGVALQSLLSYARGSIIRGGAADWEALAIGAAGAILVSDGVDIAWSTSGGISVCNITMGDDCWIGLGAAGGRIIFDSTPAPHLITVDDAQLLVNDNVAIANAGLGITPQAASTLYITYHGAPGVARWMGINTFVTTTDGTDIWGTYFFSRNNSAIVPIAENIAVRGDATNASTAGGTDQYGARFQSVNGNIPTITNAWGVYANAENNFSGTITNAYGVQAQIESGAAGPFAGTITTGICFHAIVQKAAAATLGTIYGLKIGDWVTAGATVTSYGIHLDTTIDVGTTRYAIYSLSTSVSYLAGNLGLGTTTVPHGAVGYAKLALEGANANATGPHVQFTTASDDYPLMQILPWQHDDVSLMFDAYYDGAERSSDVGSNFRITKSSDKLSFDWDASIAQGNVVTWVDSIVIDSTSSGWVGIGTDSPDARLEAEDTGIDLLKLHRVTETNGATCRQYFATDTTYYKSMIYHVRNTGMTNGRGDLCFSVDSNDDAADVTTGGDRKMMIQGSTGRVAIGSHNPSFQLDIRDNSTSILLGMNTVGGAGGGAGGSFYTDDGAATASGDRLGFFTWGGAENAAHTLHNAIAITAYAVENWGAAANGANMRFETTAIGAAVRSERMRLCADGDIGIGATAPPTANGGMVLFFGDNTADPTMAANTAGFYAKDVGGTVEAFAVDEAGNAAQLTPHDPETGEWIFFTKNVRTGRVLKVQMERLVKFLDEHFGTEFVEEYMEEIV